MEQQFEFFGIVTFKIKFIHQYFQLSLRLARNLLRLPTTSYLFIHFEGFSNSISLTKVLSSTRRSVNGGVYKLASSACTGLSTTCFVKPPAPPPSHSCPLTSTTPKSIRSDNMQRFMASITHKHKIH